MQIQPSQISAQRFGEVRPPRPEQAPETRLRDTGGPVARDRADVSGGPESGQSPSERVANFAASIDQRITNLAAETGQDLSGVQAEFGGFVERIQNALADGSLEGADLERGIRNALALTTTGVREALATGVEQRDEASTTPVAGQSPAERIDSFEQRINERLGAIAEGADAETVAALREAQQTFAAGLDGLREGLGEGRANASNLGDVVQSAIAALGSSVQAALAGPVDEVPLAEVPVAEVAQREAEEPAAERNDASPLGARFDAFAEQIAERIGGLDLSGPEGGAVRAAGADFLALLEGLSSGSSDGSLSAERATSVFQSALSDFSGDLAQLFGRDDSQLALYGRNAERAT